jgi:hypothetical protein
MIRVMVAWATLMTVAVIASSEPARAANNEMGDVLVDGFYGGLIGALVGAAVMVLTDDPGDHLQYMTTGAGIGVIGGTIYGFSQVARQAMVDVDRGHFALRVPAISPDVTVFPGEGPRVTVSVALLRVRF